MTTKLNVWCSTTVTDGITSTDNKREILEEESLNGWVRNGTVSTQQLNSLFYELTLHSNPFANSPFLMSTNVSTPDNAYDMDGSTFVETDAPNLFAIYAGTLPDLNTTAPTAHKYVIRIN